MIVKSLHMIGDKNKAVKDSVYAFFCIAMSFQTAVEYYNTTKEYPLASVIRILLHSAPSPFDRRLLIYKISFFLAKLFDWNIYHIFFGLRIFTIILILYVLRSILKELNSEYIFLPLLFPYMTIFSFSGDYSYPTDFLEILFFSVMFLLILKNKYNLFILVFCLSLLNRESTVYIVPFFLYCYYSNQKKIKGLFIYFSVLLLLVLLVNFALMRFLTPSASLSLFKIFETKWTKNLSYIKRFFNLFSGMPNPYLEDFFYKLVTFSGFTYLLVLIKWRTIPRIIRIFFVFLVPVNLISALLVGNLIETRIFYPLMPGLLLSGSVILEKNNELRKAVLSIVIVTMSLFFVSDGIFLKKESEFSIKTKNFNIAEFKNVKKGVIDFEENISKYQENKLIFNLKKIKKNLLFIDSTFYVYCFREEPETVTVKLSNKSKYIAVMKKHDNYYFANMRNIRYEMSHPALQSAYIEKVILRFSSGFRSQQKCRVEWKGYFLNKN